MDTGIASSIGGGRPTFATTARVEPQPSAARAGEAPRCFATKVNWHQIGSGIRGASRPMLLAAALVNIASILVKAVRWWVFLRPIGATSPGLALRATFAGAGLNNVLVANGGEAAPVVFVSRSAPITSARVLATLALERLFELVGYFVMLALAAAFPQLPPPLPRARPAAIALRPA